MKTSLYSQRIELNNWEIIGIENFLNENFDYSDFIYIDKSIHFDIDENSFSVFKIRSGDDLYFTLFNDESENRNFRLNLADDNFYELTENLDFIAEFTNLENL